MYVLTWNQSDFLYFDVTGGCFYIFFKNVFSCFFYCMISSSFSSTVSCDVCRVEHYLKTTKKGDFAQCLIKYYLNDLKQNMSINSIIIILKKKSDKTSLKTDFKSIINVFVGVKKNKKKIRLIFQTGSSLAAPSSCSAPLRRLFLL